MGKERVWNAWAGFVNGIPCIDVIADEYDHGADSHRRFLIFTNYKDARKRFQDVRRVEIRILDPRHD